MTPPSVTREEAVLPEQENAMSTNPALTDALRFIEGLLTVSGDHRARRNDFEHGTNTAPIPDTANGGVAGTDRTILIGQMDAAATAIEELRHSPHLWAAPDRLAALDVETLARAIRATVPSPGACEADHDEFYAGLTTRIAAEYAALHTALEGVKP